MRGKRKSHLFVVKVPAVVTKRDGLSYVRDAVRGWAGGGHPEDPLFGTSRKIVVKSCLYDIEQDTVNLLKVKLESYFRKNEVSSGVYCDIMKIVDDHLDGAV